MTPATIDELILKHNYYVKVFPVDDGIVRVVYDDKFITEYSLYSGDHDGIIFHDEAGEYVEALDIPLPVIRLYILCDIHRHCREINLPYHIVKFFNVNNDVIDLVELVPISMDENEKEQEKLLQKYVGKCYSCLDEGNDEGIRIAEKRLAKAGLLHWALLLKGLIV